MFLGLFLGLLLSILLLYLLNYANEAHSWHQLEQQRQSQHFRRPSQFEHRELEILNYQPRVLAVYDLLSRQEQADMLALSSGFWQVTNVARLTGQNHESFHLLQRRVAALTQRPLSQVGPVEMTAFPQDLPPSQAGCVLFCFLGETEAAQVDFKAAGLLVSPLPGMALWWYRSESELEADPDVSGGSIVVLRLQVGKYCGV